ncbi:MAG: TIGR04283 family arsenosugar biosynthesis glycosyltransferase [Pseudomonadota bacterium]
MGQISVIIPTLNAAGALRRSLPGIAAFGALSMLREVIFADGGSSDETAAIAEAAGAVFIDAPRGRGTQLAAGAERAVGDWFLFLHADTVLEPGWENAVAAFIEVPENTERVAYFRFKLDDASLGARWLESLVALRCRLFRLPYGDQGMLISKTLYHRLGGFKAIPLMEDVDFVRRAGRGRMAALDTPATTSASRYRKDGYLMRPLRNLTCLTLYFLGVPPRTIVKLYG